MQVVADTFILYELYGKLKTYGNAIDRRKNK
jgi:hypothetical protein